MEQIVIKGVQYCISSGPISFFVTEVFTV